MKFTKMHGSGNDYIYIDARGMDEDWPSLSRQMSDRHFGIGGDGIILILESQIADLKMRMFNADGSEGEMCGNGIRCFAKYAIERGIVPSAVQSLEVETLAGLRTTTIKSGWLPLSISRHARHTPQGRCSSSHQRAETSQVANSCLPMPASPVISSACGS